MAKAIANQGNVSAFRDNFQKVVSSFETFEECEKLIGLNSLLYQVPIHHVHFLLNVLEKRVRFEPPDPAGAALEREANDIGEYILSNCSVLREEKSYHLGVFFALLPSLYS